MVDIQLENCEVFSFKKEDILSLEFEGLKEYLCFGKMRLKAKHTLIVIDRYAEPEMEDWQEDKDWFSRIKRFSDITHIYIDGKAYTVNWNPRVEEFNLNQKVYLDSMYGEEDVVIVISPTKKTEADFS